MNKPFSLQMIPGSIDEELVGVLLNSLLRLFVLVEVVSEGAVDAVLAGMNKKTLEALFHRQVRKSSGDEIPQVLVDKLN